MKPAHTFHCLMDTPELRAPIMVVTLWCFTVYKAGSLVSSHWMVTKPHETSITRKAMSSAAGLPLREGLSQGTSLFLSVFCLMCILLKESTAIERV